MASALIAGKEPYLERISLTGGNWVVFGAGKSAQTGLVGFMD